MKDVNENLFVDENGYYKDKNFEEFKDYFDEILQLWQLFLDSQDENLTLDTDYYVHKRNLYEVIKRLDKRKTYYYVFHKIEKTCEYKRVAIMCYWINTLKPFMVVNEKSKVYSCPNEMFSLYLIITTLAGIFKEYYPDKKFELINKEDIRDYVYNFKYCDLSREAMIFFVETLAKSYGLGMEILSRK